MKITIEDGVEGNQQIAGLDRPCGDAYDSHWLAADTMAAFGIDKQDILEAMCAYLLDNEFLFEGIENVIKDDNI